VPPGFAAEDLARVLDVVLRKLAGGWPAARLDELLPDRWQLLYAAEDSPSG
jgi:hypothetical protein